MEVFCFFDRVFYAFKLTGCFFEDEASKKKDFQFRVFNFSLGVLYFYKGNLEFNNCYLPSQSLAANFAKIFELR
jgi:hypothetical protein